MNKRLILRIENLHKSFGSMEVIKGISLDVPEGEVVVIIGPSGTGKSTLLGCINLLTPPTSGSVWFEDTDITSPGINGDLVRRKIGMVFQEIQFIQPLDRFGQCDHRHDQSFGI